jgi:hypothetical protein
MAVRLKTGAGFALYNLPLVIASVGIARAITNQNRFASSTWLGLPGD